MTTFEYIPFKLNCRFSLKLSNLIYRFRFQLFRRHFFTLFKFVRIFLSFVFSSKIILDNFFYYLYLKNVVSSNCVSNHIIFVFNFSTISTFGQISAFSKVSSILIDIRSSELLFRFN